MDQPLLPSWLNVKAAMVTIQGIRKKSLLQSLRARSLIHLANQLEANLAAMEIDGFYLWFTYIWFLCIYKYIIYIYYNIYIWFPYIWFTYIYLFTYGLPAYGLPMVYLWKIGDVQ